MEIKQEALRFDNNKIRFDLIPTEGLLELARVYTMGAIKYEDNNWRKGMKFSRCIASLERHWNLWKSGQEVDIETGCHHLGQVCWNAMTLLVYCLTKTGTDDRIKFELDEKFNLKNNHLNIGLDEVKIQNLKDKYKDRK
jgi:aryl-alcohol dehydrogenase-like predicted oxidoreductase